MYTIMYICYMVTYRERVNSRKYYVINKDNVTIGLFTTLKNLCEYMKVKNPDFPSYWTIIRMDKSETIHILDYNIQEIKIK